MPLEGICLRVRSALSVSLTRYSDQEEIRQLTKIAAHGFPERKPSRIKSQSKIYNRVGSWVPPGEGGFQIRRR